MTQTYNFKDDTMTTVNSNIQDIIDVDELIESQRGERSRGAATNDVESPPVPKQEEVKAVPPSWESVPKTPIHEYAEGDLPMTKGHHTADPFAPREGKTLVWRDVNMTLVCFVGFVLLAFVCLLLSFFSVVHVMS